MRKGICILGLLGLAIAHAPSAHAIETSTASEASRSDFERLTALDQQLEEIVIQSQRSEPTAVDAVVRARDLLLRPRRRSADLLEVTPGLKVVQHAGGGKANQYFIRGFDADHGTDLALTVDGVPVNMVSHGHGQGYSDLHFVIPELVDRLEVKKGPYHAELGDFATAGAVDFVMKDEVEHSSLGVAAGMFDTYRGLVATSPTLGPVRTLLAAELHTTQGPFENGEDLERFNVFTRGQTELWGGKLTLTGTGYGATWNASGQIPDREVAAGRLDRYGAIDPTEGGRSRRFNGYVKYERLSGQQEWTAAAYVSHARLNLFSNFTFFSRDSERGDMIEQEDDRILAGGTLRYARYDTLGPFTLHTRLGAQTRSDFIQNGLFYNEARNRLETVVDANLRQTSFGVYADEQIQWTDWLVTTAGVRGDLFDFSVQDRGVGVEAGDKQAFLLSPKVSLTMKPFERTEVFVRFGMGFHSNDARGVVQSQNAVTPLTSAMGYEVGGRTRLFDRLDLATTLFALDLDSEIVWVGDEGTTEASGATRRMGIEAEARLKLASWLYADVDVTMTRARFVDEPAGADRIPLAPRLTLSGGVSAIHPAGVFGRMSFTHIGDRPATEDGFITALEVNKADVTLGYRNRIFEATLTVQNLLNTDIREAQFATTSRLAHETSGATCPQGTRAVTDGSQFAGCEDLHFTPGPPLSVQLGISMFF